MADGSLNFDTKIDTSGVSSGMSEVGSAAQKGLGVATAAAKAMAVGLAAATTAVAALTKQAVESYAEYEQLTGGVETLFKDSSDLVMEYANNAYKSAGLSSNEYMETITGFAASLLQGLGGDTEQAAEIGNMAVEDMSDNANKMGTDMTLITNAYQGFAKQNYTMLDNLKLGYGGTKEEMERLLADAQELTGVTYDIDNFSDVISAIHVIQDEMGITGTTAKEAASTIEGSLNMTKSAWANLLTGMADDDADFDTLINNLVDSVSALSENLLPRIEIAINGVGKLIAKLLPIAINEIPTIIGNVLPDLVSAGAGMLTAIGNGIMGSLPELEDYIINISDSASKYLEDNTDTITDTVIGIVNTALDGIEEMLPYLFQLGTQFIVSLCQGLGEALPALLDQIIEIIPTIVTVITSNLPLIIDAGCQLLTNLTQGILDAIPNLIAMLPQVITSIVDTLLASIPTIIQCGIDLLTSLTASLPDIINQIVAVLPQIIDGIINSLMEHLPDIVQAGFDLITALITDLPSIISTIISAIPNIISSIISCLISHIPDIVQMGIDLLVSLVQNLPAIISGIVGVIPSIIDSIVDAFNNGLDDMADVGLNLIKGLWNGMSNATEWLYDKVSGFASGVIDQVKSIFGIHSPSKKFKWIGQMCVEGFDEPIEDYNPYDTLSASMQANADTLAADFKSGSSTTNNNSSTQVININKEVSTPDQIARAIRVESKYGLLTEG